MFDLILWALGSLLKGTALLLVVFVLAGALRNASAAFRHLVWSGGILAALMLPFVSLAVPWRLRLVGIPEVPQQLTEFSAVTTVEAVTAVGEAGRQSGDRPTFPAESAQSAQSAASSPVEPAARWPSPRDLALWAIGVWLAGVLFVLGRLAFGAALVRRIVRRATPLASTDWTRPLVEAADRMALNRVPRLVISDRLPIPFASGVIRPIVVLPQAAREWSDRRRRAVLCHELAHVRRMDLPVNALAQLACALYWFHPLMWVAAHRLRLESERACDDLVLEIGTRPSEYADHLLQIVCRASRVRAPTMALPMAERREFEGRMLAILERSVRRDSPTPRHTATLGALALVLVLPLAALAPTRTAAPDPSQTAHQDLNRRPPASGRDVQPPQRTQVTPPQPAPAKQQAPDQQSLAQQVAQPDPDPAPSPQEANTAWRNRRQQSQSDTSKARVVTALAGALINDSVAQVREDAAYALGQLEAAGAVMPLGAALTRDASPDVRKMAAWALGQIESRDAVTALGAAATRDQSQEVRGMAIWALGQIEDPSAVPVLLAALTDASAEIRGLAAWALGTIEPADAAPPLMAALRDTSADVRVQAAWALGQIEDPRAVPALSVAMKDASPEVRRAAFWAVGQIGGEAAQPALLEALQSPDPEVRAQAARALAGRHSNPWPWPRPRPMIK